MNPSKPLSLLCLTLLLALAPPLFAETEIIPARQTGQIAEKLGETVTVEGKVHNAFWVRNQVMMITFQEERGGFVAVAFARNRAVLNEAFGGDVVSAIGGKTIRVTGEVTEFESRPQIEVKTPDQLRIVD
jgi:DNA/RNA endonuclease YhcR with UshA esterase domain